MTGNVIKFYPANADDSPDAVLERAIGEFDQVVVIGFNKAGTFEARITSGLTMAEVNMLSDTLKWQIIEYMMSGDYE